MEETRRAGAIAADEARRLAILGTFDVKNFGDLLFPLIAAWRLGDTFDLRAYSPRGGGTGWADCTEVASFRQLITDAVELDGFIIGGGNIIHLRSARLDDYAGGLDSEAYASLWLGATALASLVNKPVVWNAPGVPYLIEPETEKLVQLAMNASDYVSVRDEHSRSMLRVPDNSAINIVPDTALDIAKMWPKPSLKETFSALLSRLGATRPANMYFTVHVKRRSVDNFGVVNVCRLIEAFSNQSGLVPIIIAIGPCHGDDHIAREIGHLLKVDHLVLSEPLGLKEIAAAISYSQFYVGCSLHGYVAARSYGVRGRVVAIPNLAKHSGFMTHMSSQDDLAYSWEEAFCYSETLSTEADPVPQVVFDQIDQHWYHIIDALKSPEPGLYVRRTRYLRSLVHQGLSKRGWSWLLPNNQV